MKQVFVVIGIVIVIVILAGTNPWALVVLLPLLIPLIPLIEIVSASTDNEKQKLSVDKEVKGRTIGCYSNLRKGFLKWVKSPFGLVIFLIGVIFHVVSSPLYLYVERDRERLNWTVIKDIEFKKSGGRFGSYKIIATDYDDKKYGFSSIGFKGGETLSFVNSLSESSKIGWYSTCFYLKSPVVGESFFTDECAVIMEVSNTEGTVIAFEDRLQKIEQNYYYYFLLEIYFQLAIYALFGLSSLVFFCTRNHK